MDIFIVLCVCVLLTVCYLYRKLTFWSSQGIPNEPASMYNRFLKPFHIADHESAHKYGDVVGIYEGLTPCLMVKDVELAKKIMVEEFWKFPNHRKFYVEGQLASQSIVVLEDQKWKRMRQILSPVFSPAKLKAMNHLAKECIDTLIVNLCELTSTSSREAQVDIRNYFGSFSLDFICSLVFGIKINSLKHPNSEIVRQVQSFFGKSLSPKQLLLLSFPWLMETFDCYLLNYKVLVYLNDLTKRILSERQLEEKLGQTGRKDFIKLLMDATEANGRGLSEQEIADQIILFLVAGYDTSATSLSVISYCLAINQPVQRRLQQEVDQYWKNNMRKKRMGGEDSEEEEEDSVDQLKYLEAVIKESIRFLPVVPRVERRCKQDCDLTSGQWNIHVPKDAIVIIPIYSLHHDARYFKDPETFNPDRFLDPEQEEMMNQAYIPFATGPRSCIGQRFALMELKKCMLHVVHRFEFDVCSGEKSELQYFRGNPVSTPKRVLLKIRRRHVTKAKP